MIKMVAIAGVALSIAYPASYDSSTYPQPESMITGSRPPAEREDTVNAVCVARTTVRQTRRASADVRPE